jgi:nicotinamide/nicotinate riboside kinase
MIVQMKTFNSTKNGERTLQDWDCAEAMDFPLFERTLKHVHDHGKLPEDMYSKEDQNKLGESHVDEEAIQQAKMEAEKWFAGLELPNGGEHIQLCILDGFLLYSDPSNPLIPPSVTNLLDLKLFLRSTEGQTVERRSKRDGYVTLGDFWVDPPGYVEDVVWPNYVLEHAWMFEGGDVDQGECTEKVKEEGVVVAPGMGERKMGELMAWGIEIVKESVKKSAKKMT